MVLRAAESAFLLYATAYAAVAALVSRQEEVSGAIAPIGILLAGSYLLVFVALPSPSSPLVTICSLLPPFAPILMSVRMARSYVAPWQVGLALGLTLATRQHRWSDLARRARIRRCGLAPREARELLGRPSWVRLVLTRYR